MWGVLCVCFVADFFFVCEYVFCVGVGVYRIHPTTTPQTQLKLMCSATRTMALPVGRGAFTLSTLRPVPTQPVITPQLNLAGQLPEQHNATITINWDLAVAAPAGGAMADFTAWPEYHNGCAAGSF